MAVARHRPPPPTTSATVFLSRRLQPLSSTADDSNRVGLFNERDSRVKKVDDLDFKRCWHILSANLFTTSLLLSAVIGGLLLGYNTGVVSCALPYIQDEFKSVDDHPWLQEIIVSAAIVGALIGIRIGEWMNDRLGLKKSLQIADVIFIICAITMAYAPSPWVLVVGRIFVGLGIGMTFMTLPLYLSETLSARYMGALVCANYVLFTVGQFLSNLISLAFTEEPATWRWMLWIAGIPAAIQFILLLPHHESPKWLYKKGDKSSAGVGIQDMYRSYEDVVEAGRALELSVKVEKTDEGSVWEGNIFMKVKNAWRDDAQRGIFIVIAIQVFQHFTGISAIMYYSSIIVQMAGVASNRTSLMLSLIPSGLNAVGSIFTMIFVDRHGRKRMIISMFGTFTCLLLLSGVFFTVSPCSPSVNIHNSEHLVGNSTCMSYATSQCPSSWNRVTCLKACSLYVGGANNYDCSACLVMKNDARNACYAEESICQTKVCSGGIGTLVAELLGAYTFFYSIGMGTVPWILKSKLCLLRYRGFGGGFTLVFDGVLDFIVSGFFLSLIEALGSAYTFLLFAGFSFIGLASIYWLVPETEKLKCE